MKVLVLRNFRLKHEIPLLEVARQMGTSTSWPNRIELGHVSISNEVKEKIITAYQNIIESRDKALGDMRADFETAKGCFFEEENEWTDQ